MFSFTTISALAQVALERINLHAIAVLGRIYDVQLIASTYMFHVLGALLMPMAPAAACTANQDQFVALIATGITAIVGILTGVGVAVAVIGIIIGGFMRATSFGNERKVAMSNTAITCAVVGLVIVLVSVTLGNAVPGWFGLGAKACTL